MQYLVVGLGNPGREYENTRHNVGYAVIDELCQRYSLSLRKETPNSIADTAIIASKKVLVAKPSTYMNDSGIGVSELLRRYKLEPQQLIVIHDELDLQEGVLKLKQDGGLAGHNGLRSITNHIKSKNYVRVRIGVGKPVSKEQGANHVLRKLNKKAQQELDIVIQKASDAVETIISQDLDAAMRIFH